MKENARDVAGLSLDKEIMDAAHELNEPSQKKPEIEMRLYQQKHYQLELKETEKAG